MRSSDPVDREAHDTHVHQLDAAAVMASADPDRAIASLPWLDASITADRDAGAFSAWGESTIIDENTGEPVIGTATLRPYMRGALQGIATCERK